MYIRNESTSSGHTSLMGEYGATKSSDICPFSTIVKTIRGVAFTLASYIACHALFLAECHCEEYTVGVKNVCKGLKRGSIHSNPLCVKW